MPYTTMSKSAVRTDAARTRRRREDDYPSAPVAQRASRMQRAQREFPPDVRTDTEEPVFRHERQDYARLPVTNPGGRVRQQDGDHRPVTNPGGKRRGGEGEHTTSDEREDREPQTKLSRVRHRPSQRRDRVGLIPFSCWLKTLDRRLLITLAIILTIIVVSSATMLFFTVCDAVSDYHNVLTYGPIPTSRVVGVFGHNDDQDHPTTILATNTNGTLIFYEIAGGDGSKTKSYTPTFRLVGKNADKFPLILKVSDLNGDNRPDVLVTIPGQSVSFQLLNNGESFTLKTLQG